MSQLAYILITSFCTLVFAFYGYVIVLAFIGLRQAKRMHTPYEYQPKVSIVIPFRNEGHNIRQLLKDLARQFYPISGYEVVLVNDHSSFEELQLVKEYLERTSVKNILLLSNPKRGKKSALAYGMSKAHAPLILQTDADCRLPEHWINDMVQLFRDASVELVLGPVAMISGKGFWSRFAALDFLSLQASGLGLALMGRSFMGSAANMAYRKSTWLKHADFEGVQQSGDDTFLIQSLAKKNASAIAVAGMEAALVKTKAPDTFTAFFQQRLRWGGKSKNYKSAFAKALAVDVFLLNAFFLLLLALSFIDHSYIPFLLSFFITKFYLDLSVLIRFAQISRQRKLLRLYSIISLVYPFYIVGTSLTILLAPGLIRWKGDPVQKAKVKT